MGDGDIVIGEDLYDDGDPATYSEPDDPISQAIGAAGFVTPHTVDDCVQQLPGGWDLGPESFDRFYWEPERVLIDLLTGATSQELEEERDARHCEFKAGWCAENGYRYVVLTEDLLADPFGLEDVLAGGSDASTSSEEEKSEPKPGTVAALRAEAAAAGIDVPAGATKAAIKKLLAGGASPAAAKAKAGAGKVQRPRARSGRGKVQRPRA